MKFLTFGDLHDDKPALKDLLARAEKPDIDFVVSVGDISVFGRGLRNILKRFNSLGKKFYVIPGNHESDSMLNELTPEFPNCINFHQKILKMGTYLFLGYGEGGFTLEDPRFRKIAREWYGKYKGKNIVLVTHQPPFGTKLDFLETRHVGNKDFRKFIERIKPKLAISGHLHETVGIRDKIGPTRLVNPGWDGLVIELK